LKLSNKKQLNEWAAAIRHRIYEIMFDQADTSFAVPEDMMTKRSSLRQSRGSFRAENSRISIRASNDPKSQKTIRQIEQSEQVELDFDLNIPSFKIQLLKLKLMPGLKVIAKPAMFDEWVTLSLSGMSLWHEKRLWDD